MPIQKYSHAYAGYKPCGCMVGAHVDGADKSTGDWVREMIAMGLRVERVPVEDVRGNLTHCIHEDRQLSLFDETQS